MADVMAAQPEAQAPTGRAGTKRKQSVVKVISVEEVAAKIKRLQEEADQKEAAAKELEASAMAERAVAAEKRTQAHKASLEYSRLQREAALAKLEASVPKKPMNPWFLFSTEILPTLEGHRQADKVKKASAIWAAMSSDEKKKYTDKFAEENKKYSEWASSEEGLKITREREEVLRECRASSASNLAEATAAVGAGDGAFETPVKKPRARSGASETPAPKSRARPARAAATPTKAGALLDEDVLLEARKADLEAQLLNLAGRPDVAALNKSSQELLDALKANQGIVNAAKRSLLD